ncbi:MAG: outer membrane beta-barrel protein [Acidobacteria bacterium]|nr:outer membrane beta-barrel protein [Acidobacteriota bacterium]
MRSVRFVSCALVLFALTAVPAAAQSITFPASAPHFSTTEQSGSSARPQTRGGFWFSGGLGVGSLGCEDCDEREISGAADISLGGTLGDRLLLGVGLAAWSKEEDGATLTASTLEARLRFYPIAEKGFYLTGGLGLGSLRVEFDGIGDDTQNGVGLTLGLGWDIRVGRNVSVTPFWHGTAVSADEADANFGTIGVAVTIH